jgi:hypothetical protein
LERKTAIMSNPTSRIVELAAIIQAKTLEYDTFLAGNNISTPSFNPSCPPILDLPKDVSATKDELLAAMDELQALILGPVGGIFHDITNRARKSSATAVAGSANSFLATKSGQPAGNYQIQDSFELFC